MGATAHPTTPMKYEYDTHTVGAGAPGNTYSGPIEGAAGPQPEIKYSCSVDFSRHQSGKRDFIYIKNCVMNKYAFLQLNIQLAFFLLLGRSAIEHVHHNHTYHLPAESSGSLQRPISRDKKSNYISFLYFLSLEICRLDVLFILVICINFSPQK